MTNPMARRHLGAAFVLAALLLASPVIVALKVATSDAAPVEPYGIDILALNPEHE